MRTIYFDVKDIKESKIALVNQKITPLQSAFLMQYITNLEEQLQQKEDIINKAKKYIKNNSHKTEWGDLEQDNESIDINDDVTDTEFITDLIEILNNKGEMKDE